MTAAYVVETRPRSITLAFTTWKDFHEFEHTPARYRWGIHREVGQKVDRWIYDDYIMVQYTRKGKR